MDSDTSRMTGSMLLLLSLLLHILLLLFLFIYQNSDHILHRFEHPESDVPLLDNQLNQMQQQQQDDPFDPDHEVLVELLSQGIEPNDTLTDEAGELSQPSLIGIQQPPIPDDAQSQEDETDDQSDEKDQPFPTETEKPSDEPPSDQPHADQLIKGSEELQLIADTISGTQPALTAQKPLTPKQAVKKNVRKMAPRPTISPANAQALSKLAQGFMQSMNAEFGGKPSNDPKQLAHQRYMTKLWNNLKQAMNAENNVLALNDNIDTQAVLVLTINKQGKLLNALMRHPRKTNDIQKMETMFITNAHKVGLFPPLPESFNREEVTFVMPIHLRAHQGIHSGYRLQVER